MSTLFTPRERQIMDLKIEGMCEKQIALTLSIAPKTVNNVIRLLKDKLEASGVEVRNMPQLAVYYVTHYRQDLLPSPVRLAFSQLERELLTRASRRAS